MPTFFMATAALSESGSPCARGDAGGDDLERLERLVLAGEEVLQQRRGHGTAADVGRANDEDVARARACAKIVNKQARAGDLSRAETRCPDGGVSTGGSLPSASRVR